jgi:hypothetical protein
VAPLSVCSVTLEQEAMPGTIRAITSIMPVIVALFISSPFYFLYTIKTPPVGKRFTLFPGSM